MVCISSSLNSPNTNRGSVVYLNANKMYVNNLAVGKYKLQVTANDGGCREEINIVNAAM